MFTATRRAFFRDIHKWPLKKRPVMPRGKKELAGFPRFHKTNHNNKDYYTDSLNALLV
jgi:hypothetical protein